MTCTDQTGHTIRLPHKPQRIVSLVPSQTELLFDLGLGDKVIGITKFCIHPKELIKSKTIVGGTKKLNIDRIRSLQPDLIIANKEENEKDQIEMLRQEFPVWTSDISDLDSALDMINLVGEITSTTIKAKSLALQIQNDFDSIGRIFNGLSVAYFIWKDPYMVAARNTFIDDLLNRCGLKNVFGKLTRYPQISEADIRNSNPDLLFLSSEPYPFKEKHQTDIKALFPNSYVCIVDGEMFSWYGSRLLKSPLYFKQLSESIPR